MEIDEVYEKYDEIEYSLATLHDMIREIKLSLTLNELKELTSQHLEVIKDLKDDTISNIKKLNVMTNELKGVVSMARASLQEGKKFSAIAILLETLTEEKNT